MRETHTAQTSIFQTAIDHEIAYELKRMSDWLDGQPELLDQISKDLQSVGGSRRGDNAFLPTLVQLAKMANVSSPDTVWRALLILRCSRWLTSCHRMWCKSGFEPSAYVANAEPLPLADTLFLDPNYVECLRKCSGHAHARIRKVAGDILSQLPEEIRNKPVERPTVFGVKI